MSVRSLLCHVTNATETEMIRRSGYDINIHILDSLSYGERLMGEVSLRIVEYERRLKTFYCFFCRQLVLSRELYGDNVRVTVKGHQITPWI